MTARERQPMLAGLLERRLLVLIGKGGVGKTTLAVALGQAAARSGKRVLLAEVRAPRRIPPLLGQPAETDGPLQLGERLSWRNFTPEIALEVYGMQLLKLRTVYRAVFEQQAVRRFLRVIPSLAEILILGHLRYLIDTSAADLIVLDAPSTGPGALMLEAPAAVIEAAPPGPLREAAGWIREMFSDPAVCAVNLVVLAEELPISEAIDLHHRLRDRVGVPLGVVLVNRVLADPFSGVDEGALAGLTSLPQAAHLAQAAKTYRARLGQQATYLDRLRAGIDLPAALLPEATGQPFVPAAMDELGRAFGKLLGVAP